MGYEKYAAHFVMLTEQNNVFSFRTTLPIKGHIKIETGNDKGAMRVVIQNMRYYEKGPYIYKLILFGKKRERTIHHVAGTVAVNRYGNGETYLRFDPLDMDGKGNPLSAFSVAIIVAVSVKNEKESLHPVLKGEIVVREGSERNAEEDAEEEAEAEGEHSSISVDFFGSQPEEERFSEPLGEEEPPTAVKKSYTHYYNRYLVDACRRTIKMSIYYDDVVPFQNDTTHSRWKKIVNVGNLPVVSPGARYFATKYRHYIFGIGEERCYIGIPGKLLNEEQPDRGESGFAFWQPIIGANKTEASYGYWIAAINMESGDVEEV